MKGKMRHLKEKAQSFGDYVLVIALISTLLMGLDFYFKRSLQAHIKYNADLLGNQSEWRKNDDGSAINANSMSFSKNAQEVREHVKGKSANSYERVWSSTEERPLDLEKGWGVTKTVDSVQEGF